MDRRDGKRPANAHCLQAREYRRNIPFERVLRSDSRKRPYHSRQRHELRTVIHWGQRKLLMSEIEFLHADAQTSPLQKTCVVIYAGAAPGTHVKCLSRLFPDHIFVLVDPAPFSVVPDGVKIITKNAMFSDELAIALRGKHVGDHVLFISDVRSADYELQSAEENEQRIKIDMEAQAQWHRTLRPFKSMLKFRLPYTPGTTRYLDGEIFLPVWGPISTTECRLVVDTDAGERDYDHTVQEQQMFYFNTVTRPAMYAHDVSGHGIDHCYDCMAEICILKSILGGSASNKAVAALSARISSDLSRERTLESPNPDPAQRKLVIRKNQWVNNRPAYDLEDDSAA